MKPLLAILVLLMLSQCKSPQTMSSETVFLQITLGDNVKPERVAEDFKASGLTSLKASSRSQPLYMAEVKLPKSDLKKLMKALKADERVKDVLILDNKPDQNTNSTNDGFGTSKPINK